MHVENYKVRHILGVDELSLPMEGKNLVVVGGANAQGKSSALTALLMAVQGKRGMPNYPDIPLKDGEGRGYVKVKFSGDAELQDEEGVTAELYYRQERGKKIVDEFRIVDSTGEEAPSPRGLMQSFLAKVGLDPLAFDRLPAKERRAAVAPLLDVPYEQLKAAEEKPFEERTVVNRELKKAEARLAAMDCPDAPDDPVSSSELFGKLEEARAHNDTVEASRVEADVAWSQCSAAKEDVAACEVALQQAQHALDLAKAAVEKATAEGKRLDAANEKLKKIDTSDLEGRIANADAINETVRQRQAYVTAEAQAEELRAQSEALTDEIELARDATKDAMANAPWPVEGMSMDEKDVLLNGLPYEQASKSQRITAACKIAMMQEPKLRLLVCQDGNDLDTETLEALESVLKEHDFQMLLEMVTRTSEDEARCAVVLKDGRAKE